MKTLIELYDERPMENVLAGLMFRPERVVYIAQQLSDREKKTLRDYFAHRGLAPELVFLSADPYSSKDVCAVLGSAVEKYPDCALDISGGTDNALFAAGRISAARDLAVFTYSRRQNRFYNISNAPFAQKLDCDLQFAVEDFFLMAGGSMRRGRVDNSILEKYLPFIDSFFEIYMRFSREWGSVVSYFQRASQQPKDQPVSLEVQAGYSVKGEHGRRINANEKVLRELERLGFIRNLSVQSGESVSFSFMDSQVRTWLRDVGSVLELYTYKLCVDQGIFSDVRTSVVVDWESNVRRDSVTNEIDVMTVRGITPMFISCKTCEVDTQALNELAILRDRFGGQGAKAAIITTKHSAAVTRNRAAELGITVIDQDDLRYRSAGERLKALALRTD